MDSWREHEFISLVTEIAFLASSKDWDSEVASLFTQLFSAAERIDWDTIESLIKQIMKSRKTKMEFLSVIDLIKRVYHLKWNLELSLFIQIIYLVCSMDLDSESELISVLIKQIIFFFNSKSESESELLSLVTQIMCLNNISVDSDSELLSLIRQLVSLRQPDQELTSFIGRIISSFRSMDWEPKQLMSLCPQVEVELVQGKFRARAEILPQMNNQKEECGLVYMQFLRYTRKDYFHCQVCHGEYHEESVKAPTQVNHPLHPKHSLQLVFQKITWEIRQCYCCDEDLIEIFYYCSACDFAMNIVCVEKPQVLSIDCPKWHEHTLALFPSQASFPCNLCALTHTTSCPFYICPPCDFVVHRSCLSLPHVIRISRHHHRIAFTSSFDKGNLFCGVCRKKIDSDYGGYSCIKDNCSYTAHSKCATQSNVWDGKELEGVPEESEEEELEPFVRISDGIIRYFRHEHHLRLDENTCRDYDENKLCQACITPIYFGNFYSCVQCEFTLHEKCANLSRRLYHPIHPHRLTLVADKRNYISSNHTCAVCPRLLTGFFYECGKEGCYSFNLHVQCATISEPVVHQTHAHPLFLTCKPGEQEKTCGLCNQKDIVVKRETFNCIECEFSLCFGCATIPQQVRYKHDKHMLTLCYGEETSTTTSWCEACETKIKPEGGFYKCDEYCCVTIHIKCLIGKDYYMKPGLSVFHLVRKDRDTVIEVLPNNHRMSRPSCSECYRRCPQKVVFKGSGLMFCSLQCIIDRAKFRRF